MIMPGVEPHASLLVGVDYATATGHDHRPGRRCDRRAAIARHQVSIVSSRVASRPAPRIEIHGDDLNGADLEVVLGNVVLTVTERRPDFLVVTAEGSPGGPIAAGTTISAGEIPLVVRRRLSATRTRIEQPARRAIAADGEQRQHRRRQSRAAPACCSAPTPTTCGAVLSQADGRTVRLFDTVTTAANQQTLTVPASPPPSRRAAIA